MESTEAAADESNGVSAQLQRLFLDGTLLLLLALLTAHLSVAAVLVAHLPLSPWTLTPALGLLGGLQWAALSRLGLRVSLQAVFLASTLAAACVLASSFIYDTSFDGQIYHQDAVVQLHDGWNPLYDPSLPSSPWVRHYAKAPWMIAAFLYEFIPRIEVGKASNSISIVASLLASYAVLASVLGARSRLLVAAAAACLACNPVVLAQAFTYYNDGLVGSLLLTYVAMLALYLISANRKALAAATVCLPILLNSKFTAIGSVAVVSAAFMAVLYIRRSPALKRASFALCLVGAASVVIVGFNPYITNTLSKGHPFFPLAGEGKVDIMTPNLPAEFIGKNRFEKFALSLSGRTADVLTGPKQERKRLFSIHVDEFAGVAFDTRIAGFGPLSMWIAVSSTVLWFFLIGFDPRRGALAGAVAGTVLITVFLHPECWWARYVPQLWLVPMIVVAAALRSPRRAPVVAAWVVLALVGANAAGSGAATLAHQVRDSYSLHRFFSGLEGRSVVLTGGRYTSVPIHLKERGIPFIRAGNETACPAPIRVPFSDVDMCVKP